MGNELDILLVEDDLDTCINLSDILELDGHRVRSASTGKEARTLATDQSICLVILDRQLPDATADTLLPDLKQLLPNAEIIVVTGYADLDSTIAAFRQGAADYILKPINPDALRQSVQRIVQRRRIERELEREHKFSDTILKTAEAVVLVLDLEGGIIRFNPFFEQVSGWKLADLKGENWFLHCLPKRDRDRLREVFIRTAIDIKTSGIINPILTSQGSERQIRWSNTTLKDEEDEAYAILAVGVDVTELVEAQTKSLQTERLAAIGQTMTALAHESRNALQRMQASLELLELEVGEDPDVRQDLDSLTRAKNDLQNLLEEIRSFAAPIQLNRVPCSLPEIWRRAWRNLAVTRENRDFELSESLDNNEPILKLDVTRLEQVFRNLFENSLAACGKSARIGVTYRGDDAGEIEILVKDNGPGFTSEQQERLFEPFFTTKDTGTGLGMAIVDRIIRAHEGTISVAESETPGAAIRIRLPSTLKHTVDV